MNMNVKKTLGTIGVTVESLGLSIELGGFETEMTDLSVAEYIDILKHQKEIAELQSGVIKTLIEGLQPAFDGGFAPKTNPFEEMLKAKSSEHPFAGENPFEAILKAKKAGIMGTAPEAMKDFIESKIQKAESLEDLLTSLKEIPGVKVTKINEEKPPFPGGFFGGIGK